jgi:ribonuclease D
MIRFNSYNEVPRATGAKPMVYKNDIPATLKATSKIMAIDTETMGLNLHRDRLCVFQFSFGDGIAHLVHFVPDEDGKLDYSAPNLKAFLCDDEIVKLFHYARFDVLCIKRYLGITLENIYCTKIASRLARTYTNRHSLKALVGEFTQIRMDKTQQSSWWGSDELSKEQIDYAASDVMFLHTIMEKLNLILEREKRLNLAYDCFAFLTVRTELDDLGFGNFDIFQHGDDPTQ